MKVIEEQFIRSDRALASILMKRFSSKTFDYSKNVREHIMEMRDMVVQLKSLEVEISEKVESAHLATHVKENTRKGKNALQVKKKHIKHNDNKNKTEEKNT